MPSVPPAAVAAPTAPTPRAAGISPVVPGRPTGLGNALMPAMVSVVPGPQNSAPARWRAADLAHALLAPPSPEPANGPGEGAQTGAMAAGEAPLAEPRKGTRHGAAGSPKRVAGRHRTVLNVRRTMARMGARHQQRRTDPASSLKTTRTKEVGKESASVAKNRQRPLDRTHPSRLAGSRSGDPTKVGKGLADPSGTPLPAGGAPVPQGRPGQVPTAPAPICVRAAGLVQTLRNVHTLRQGLRNLPLCVPAEHAAALHGRFTYHRHADPTDGHAQPPAPWMVVQLQPEALVDAMAQLDLDKSAGLPWSVDGPSSRLEPLGNDTVCSIYSISALPAAELTALNVDARRILPRNSFALVQHRELGGSTRTHLAWFVHRHAQGHPVVNAGFLRLDIEQASYSVRDAATGLEFQSDNLVDFVTGLERISGTHLRDEGTDARAPASARRTDADIPLLQADNLFVRLDSGGQDSVETPAPQRGDVGFFDAMPFAVPEHGAAGWLYRNSFALKDALLLFRDHAGHMGTVVLQPTAADPLRYDLPATAGHAARFLQAHGLLDGYTYSADELRAILQNYGLLWLPASDEETVYPVAGVELFQPRLPAPGPTQEHHP